MDRPGQLQKLRVLVTAFATWTVWDVVLQVLHVWLLLQPLGSALWENWKANKRTTLLDFCPNNLCTLDLNGLWCFSGSSPFLGCPCFRLGVSVIHPTLCKSFILVIDDGD